MTPIHAKVASTEKYGDLYRLIVDLVPSEFLGPWPLGFFGTLTYCLGTKRLAVETWYDYPSRYFLVYRPGYEGVSPLDFGGAPQKPVSLVNSGKQKSTGKKGRGIKACAHRMGW
jgi:hypothetical protein